MKKLGFGLMRLPVRWKIPTLINLPKVKEMVDEFIKNGFTYFDTAYMYHGMMSESAVKKALVNRYPREAFTLASKLPVMPVFIRTERDQERIFEKQLEKCGVEFFDYYLIHALSAETYKLAEKLKSFDFVARKKAEGKVKKMGFSFHDKPEVLDKILTDHPEAEFVQLQINYLDWEDANVCSRECYEVAKRHKKPVIVMEPVKGGTLAKVPKEAEALFKSENPDASVASWAIRYAASLDDVMVVLSGMSNMDQLKDNVSYMTDFKPISERENDIIGLACKLIKGSIAVPCTGCGYCSAGCPRKIDIPGCFALYNAAMREKDADKKGEYRELVRGKGRASECIACRQCEKACPQHLKIVDFLKDVSKKFD